MGQNKLSIDVAESILTVGCSYNPPTGGVAQVLYNYRKYVFPVFKCVVNSKTTSQISKIFIAIYAIIKTVFVLLIDRKIKILHIHTASYNSFWRSLWFVTVGKLFHKKVILHIHGGGFKEFYSSEQEKISKILNSSDCIITLSESWQKFFLKISCCKNIEVVNNIVPEPVQISVVKDQKFHLLFLGTITNAKGIYDLIQIFSQNKDQFLDRIVLHIGGTGEVENLQLLIKENCLESIVIYEGWVSGNRKIELLNMADAFILPSYTEGLPVSILEAMAYKLPILSTPVGGIPEIVQNDENGILFNPGDLNSIVSAINYLLDNRNTARLMGDNSLRRITPYFPDNVGHKLQDLYTNLLND